jgi:hypothetical protein
MVMEWNGGIFWDFEAPRKEIVRNQIVPNFVTLHNASILLANTFLNINIIEKRFIVLL